MFFLVAYVLLLVVFKLGVIAKKQQVLAIEKGTPKRFSVVIPFRNEAHHLPLLLQTITQIHYDSNLFEIIFVNDASSDASVSIIHDWQKQTTISSKLVHVHSNKSPKKQALKAAFSVAQYQWIITTDADVLLPPNWLITINNALQNNSVKMLVAPVYLPKPVTFFQFFQFFEWTSLQIITAGSFAIHKGFMCNGANFVYQKSFFDQLNGFEGNEQWGSGDDVFLLQKALVQFPQHVLYIGNSAAAVQILYEKSWHDVLQQRTRWASKSAAYTLLFPKLVAVVALLANMYVLLAFFQGVYWGNLTFFTYIFGAKLAVDYFLIGTNLDHKNGKTLRYFVGASCLYPFFVLWIAVQSFIGTYQWKGRTLR